MGRLLATTAIAGLLAGCAGIVGLDPAAPDPVADLPAPVSFPECQADEFDFAGEGTLRGLGLHEATPVVPPDIDRVAMIWVTHDLMPHDFGPPGGPVEMIRMLCFEFPDGSGGSGWPVDPAWQPPSTDGIASESAGNTNGSLSALFVAAVGLVAVAVSVLAYRRGR